VTDAAGRPAADARRPGVAAPSWWSRFWLRGLVVAGALVVTAGIVVTDDRDPFVFAIPVLVAGAVAVAVLTLADRRRDEAAIAREADATGLEYDGVRPLPTVTPFLAGVREPAPVLRGALRRGGPAVRIARTRRHLVAITEAPAAALDPADRTWLEDQPLPAGAEIEDGLLVVAAARDAPAAELLALTRDLHARL
jgi:hypothetical protein